MEDRLKAIIGERMSNPNIDLPQESMDNVYTVLDSKEAMFALMEELTAKKSGNQDGEMNLKFTSDGQLVQPDGMLYEGTSESVGVGSDIAAKLVSDKEAMALMTECYEEIIAHTLREMNNFGFALKWLHEHRMRTLKRHLRATFPVKGKEHLASDSHNHA